MLSYAAALALTLNPTWAADDVKPPASKPGTKLTPLMTRTELRECMARQDRNKAQAGELLAEQDKLSADKAALVRDGDALKEQLPTLDRTNAEAVAKYNEQLTARDAAVNSLLARTDAFNARVEAAQAERSAYATACTNRRYDERDEAAIRNGK